MAAYMRDQFPFLGIPSPRLKALVRSAAFPKPTEASLRAQVMELWELPEREFQYVALTQLREHANLCGPGFIDVTRHLVVTKSWWDTVDELAAHVVGVLVQNHPQLVATMDHWIDDENMWLARTAILHQNRYKTLTDSERLFRYCEKQMAHKDFFIRKAIGWALREYAYTDPEAVRAFVRANEGTLSGLSKREALKNL
ncbi:MAG TPA: DNA alkylation repair protein [Micromonosporaceae bacterium]|nr:DNA alkylation repair protein [Micromonosporaceae bacterium]